MARRQKPGPRSTGLTIKKNFMVTPKTNRELAKAARDFGSEADVMRAALTAFFLAQNVRLMDDSVQSSGQKQVPA